eukprot:Awhi_evm2s14100
MDSLSQRWSPYGLTDPIFSSNPAGLQASLNAKSQSQIDAKKTVKPPSSSKNAPQGTQEQSQPKQSEKKQSKI